MANIYDVASAIQQPNIVGNFNQGVQIGQQNQVFGQKQAAYQQALGDQQNIRALAPQVIAGDPNAYSQVAAIDPNEATQLQGAGDNQVRRFAGAINMLNQATKTNNPAAIDAAWQQARPYLSQIAGKPAPDHWDPSFQPGLDQAMAHIAQLPQQKSDLVNVAAGGVIFDPKTRQAIYSNPGVQKTPPIVSVNLPDGSTQQYQQNPDGSLAPLRFGPQGTQAAQQGQFQTSITPASPVNSGAADQANALLAQGMQPQQVMQRLVQAHPDQKFQLAVDPQTGQFKDVSDGSAQFSGASPSAPDQLGRSAPKVGDSVSTLSPDDVKSLGLPAGTVAQRDSKGKISILSKGDGFNANSPQELGDPTKTGQDYLASIPADTRPTVLAVLQGRQAPPTGSAQKSSYWMGVINAANKIDPTFDTTDYQKRYKTAQDFSPSGASGKQAIALNTMIQHVGELKQAFDNLNNSGSPALNAVLNPIAYQTGLGARGLNDYNLNARTAAQEIESLWKKGSGNAADIEAMTKDLSSSADPASANKVFAKMLTLAAGKLQALKSAYQNGMGNSSVPLQLVTPESLQIMAKIDPEMASTYAQNSYAQPSGKLAGNDNPTMPAASTQSQVQPSAQPRAVNSMGHAVVWNGSAWVPE